MNSTRLFKQTCTCCHWQLPHTTYKTHTLHIPGTVHRADLNWPQCWRWIIIPASASIVAPDGTLYACDEVRIRIWQCSNFEHFQQIWNSSNVLSILLSNANSWKKNPVLPLISYAQQEVDCCQRVQTNFFSEIQLRLTTKLHECAT